MANKKLLVFSIIIAFITIFFIIFQVFRPAIEQKSSKTTLLHVGEEQIYNSDYEYELGQYPPQLVTAETKQKIRSKLISDSIILQSGAKEGFVILTPDFFNSPDKSYPKRIQMVDSVQEALDKRFSTLKAGILTIWFYNTHPASIGLERGKQVAFEKISKLHADVKSRKLTMLAAAEMIKRDTSLFELDKAYIDNAYIEISRDYNTSYTFDPDFDEILRKAPIGQPTEIHLASRVMERNAPPREMAYMFGVVTERSTNQTFEEWYQTNKENYAIIE